MPATHIFSFSVRALKFCKLDHVTSIGWKSLFLNWQHFIVCPQLFCRLHNVNTINISLLCLAFFRYLKAKALRWHKIALGDWVWKNRWFSKTVKNSKKAKHSFVDACITHCPKLVPLTKSNTVLNVFLSYFWKLFLTCFVK